MILNRHRVGTVCPGLKVFLSIALVVVAGAAALQLNSHLTPSSTAELTQDSRTYSSARVGTNPKSLATFAYVPMIFESNQGQTDSRVRFLARGKGYDLFLTQKEAVLALRHSTTGSGSSEQASVLRMSLAGASLRTEPSGNDELPGKSNYLIGNNPAWWHRDIPQFARVRYREVYAGTDLVYYGHQGQLEYDFEIAPGSDPRRVELRFQGADRLTVDPAGNLILPVAGGTLSLQAPRVYQTVGTEQRSIEGRFELRGADAVGFKVGEYDPSRTLVIDPILQYSTYLGGSADEACSIILGTGAPVSGCPAVAVDSSLSAYVVGSTRSTDFPDVSCSTSLQCSLKGTANISISKFNSSGTALLFSTYLGGNNIDHPAGVGVDGGFNVIVAGNTTSTDFPTNGSNAAFQTTPVSTNTHAFVSKLDPTGHTLLYSTYLSGNGADVATGLAVDLSGNAYVSGTTTSTEVGAGFPSTTGGYQTAPASGSTIQFFLSKINPNASGISSVPYSTYFGGGNSARPASSGPPAVGGGVAVDSSNNVYITGGTSYLHVGNATTDFPILNAYQGCLDSAPSITTCPTNVTAYDVFVAKLNPTAITGSQLLYSTYLGGTGDDIGNGITVDSSSAYITGSTTSTDFPAAGTGVFQSVNGGGTDAFLAKLGTPTTALTTVPLNYFTYLGGSGTDVGMGVAVDNIQGARIVGWTSSTNFPNLNFPVQTGFGGGASDAFVASIDTTATTPTAPGHYSTFLGGTLADYGTGIAVDLQNAAYVVGETQSADLLTVAPPITTAFQNNLSGTSDNFVSKLGPVVALTLVAVASPTPVGVGNQVTFTYTATNAGDSLANVTFTDTVPTSGVSDVSASTTTSGNACGPVSGGVILCNLGTMKAGATATVTVTLTPTAGNTPAQGAIELQNSAFVGVSGSSLATASASVVVNDFKLTVSPSSVTVAAGVPASYTATITPTGNIPNSVSLSCTSALPTGATCTETTNPIPNLDNGPASTVLIINTTARVTTTTRLWQKGGPFYALCFPVAGFTLLGFGLGKNARKRTILGVVLLAAFLSLILFQPACSSSKAITTTTGTPAGTYVVTVSATSGTSAARTATVTLVVQ